MIRRISINVDSLLPRLLSRPLDAFSCICIASQRGVHDPRHGGRRSSTLSARVNTLLRCRARSAESASGLMESLVPSPRAGSLIEPRGFPSHLASTADMLGGADEGLRLVRAAPRHALTAARPTSGSISSGRYRPRCCSRCSTGRCSVGGMPDGPSSTAPSPSCGRYPGTRGSSTIGCAGAHLRRL